MSLTTNIDGISISPLKTALQHADAALNINVDQSTYYEICEALSAAYPEKCELFADGDQCTDLTGGYNLIHSGSYTENIDTTIALNAYKSYSTVYAASDKGVVIPNNATYLKFYFANMQSSNSACVLFWGMTDYKVTDINYPTLTIGQSVYTISGNYYEYQYDISGLRGQTLYPIVGCYAGNTGLTAPSCVLWVKRIEIMLEDESVVQIDFKSSYGQTHTGSFTNLSKGTYLYVHNSYATELDNEECKVTGGSIIFSKYHYSSSGNSNNRLRIEVISLTSSENSVSYTAPYYTGGDNANYMDMTALYRVSFTTYSSCTCPNYSASSQTGSAQSLTFTDSTKMFTVFIACAKGWHSSNVATTSIKNVGTIHNTEGSTPKVYSIKIGATKNTGETNYPVTLSTSQGEATYVGVLRMSA